MFGRKKKVAVKAKQSAAPTAVPERPTKLTISEERQKYGSYPLSVLAMADDEYKRIRWRSNRPFNHRCMHCRFWERAFIKEAEERGTCQRNAPTVPDRPDAIFKFMRESYWPVTDEGGWCGQFEMHPDAEKAINMAEEFEEVGYVIEEFAAWLARNSTEEG